MGHGGAVISIEASNFWEQDLSVDLRPVCVAFACSLPVSLHSPKVG